MTDRAQHIHTARVYLAEAIMMQGSPQCIGVSVAGY